MVVAKVGGEAPLPEERGTGSDDGWFRIERPSVLEELIDGELVVIHFETGAYHGIRGAGVAVWQLLDAGWSLRDVVGLLERRYPDAGAGPAVVRFVRELERQRLLVPSSARENRAIASVEPLLADAFAPPSVESRDDLRDYLALDPIHDLDENGWPKAPA